MSKAIAIRELADFNPHLTISASPGLRLPRMTDNLIPTKAMEGSNCDSLYYQPSRHILDAVTQFRSSGDKKGVG